MVRLERVLRAEVGLLPRLEMGLRAEVGLLPRLEMGLRAEVGLLRQREFRRTNAALVTAVQAVQVIGMMG